MISPKAFSPHTAQYLRHLLLFFTLWVPASSVFGDNPLTNHWLQPATIDDSSSSWSADIRLGINEGSGDVSLSGERWEIPRLTYQRSLHGTMRFVASIPYLKLAGDYERWALGDPTFITNLQTGENTTVTIGVTEPAANRPVEPDVVRFFAFLTTQIQLNNMRVLAQVGPEIPDRYHEPGQDDVLSFGLALSHSSLPIEMHAIRKQVVGGVWYDFTKPIEHPLNRQSYTLIYRPNQFLRINNAYVTWHEGHEATLSIGVSVRLGSP